MNIATNAYQVKGSLLAGNNSIWANRSLTKNLVSQSAKIYANQAILATNGGWDKGKHSKRGEFTPFAKGDLSHLSKEADYPHWQDLRVTNSYAQKKKDSVQAVLIQRHSLEQVSRLPNNIRLPDYIGLVKYCQSSIGGWDLNLVNNVHSVDCLTLRCLRLISSRIAVTINCASLSFSCFRVSIASNTSSGTLAVFWRDLLFNVPVAIVYSLSFKWESLYLFLINKKHLKCKSLNSKVQVTLIYLVLKTTKPYQCSNTNRASNHNVKRSNTMAMYKSTQTHPKFKWRFFSCQQSKYFSVEASNEKEARSMLPDSPCLFSARIRQSSQNIVEVSA